MATRKSKSDEIYAVASATYRHGHGHITIHVHNALGDSGATIKIEGQAGGDNVPRTIYSWKFGVWKDYDVMDQATLRKGYVLMRAMKKKLDKVYDERGPEKTYAEYVLRILRAGSVRRIYLRPGVNSTYYGDPTALHGYTPIQQGDSLLNELSNMEQAILGMCY